MEAQRRRKALEVERAYQQFGATRQQLAAVAADTAKTRLEPPPLYIMCQACGIDFSRRCCSGAGCDGYQYCWSCFTTYHSRESAEWNSHWDSAVSTRVYVKKTGVFTVEEASLMKAKIPTKKSSTLIKDAKDTVATRTATDGKTRTATMATRSKSRSSRHHSSRSRHSSDSDADLDSSEEEGKGTGSNSESSSEGESGYVAASRRGLSRLSVMMTGGSAHISRLSSMFGRGATGSKAQTTASTNNRASVSAVPTTQSLRSKGSTTALEVTSD